ncbi:MAG: hypothetical protein NTV43_17420 [Methylococcales bacterium]|nr:hypothetical protein [Methylococcales bacterium]
MENSNTPYGNGPKLLDRVRVRIRLKAVVGLGDSRNPAIQGLLENVRDAHRALY